MKRAKGSRNSMRVALALIAIILLAGTVSAENYVRWNNMLDECVYYYSTESTRSHCFVPAEQCSAKIYRNELKTIDQHSCYHLKVNKPPVLSVKDITVSEGDIITLSPQCIDDEHVTLTYGGKMKTNTWRTSYTDAGTYTVSVLCADNRGAKDTKTLQVTVLEKNRPPMITAVSRKSG
jgi:hypothetical protein